MIPVGRSGHLVEPSSESSCPGRDFCCMDMNTTMVIASNAVPPATGPR